uniref:Uncharacterized protein n=1 Tax=Opuntia streptacantha TaxID=393608 RepID=A0A7C8YPD5_OPUST
MLPLGLSLVQTNQKKMTLTALSLKWLGLTLTYKKQKMPTTLLVLKLRLMEAHEEEMSMKSVVPHNIAVVATQQLIVVLTEYSASTNPLCRLELLTSAYYCNKCFHG